MGLGPPLYGLLRVAVFSRVKASESIYAHFYSTPLCWLGRPSHRSSCSRARARGHQVLRDQGLLVVTPSGGPPAQRHSAQLGPFYIFWPKSGSIWRLSPSSHPPSLTLQNRYEAEENVTFSTSSFLPFVSSWAGPGAYLSCPNVT